MPDGNEKTRFWLWLIRFVGLIVPRRLRADWRQEWEAELRTREAMLAEWDRLNWKSKVNLLWRSTSAFWDALWLQPKRWEDEMIQDLRLGVRMLVKHPSFTVIAVLTLALGIGANITIFSVVNAVLLRPLPYPDAERLVMLWSEAPAQNIRERASGYANVADWREQNKSFEDIAVSDPTVVTLTGGAELEQVMSIRATANLIPVLGVVPMLGRTFTADEVQQKVRVVVLSHGLWQRRFGGSPNVLGQTLEIDGMSSQVIGVMPEHFRGDEGTPVWEPHTLFPDWEAQKAQRGTGNWRVVGRLAARVSLAQAQTEMNAIAQRLEQAYPGANKGLGINLVPLQIQQTGSTVRLALWMLFGAVVLVLLIACTNVANLMLARGIAREREMAIRMALGAGRGRLIRQLLTESALLVLLAGTIGLLIASWGIQAVLRLSPANLPRLDGVTIDAKVLAFTTIVSLLTGLLFGLAPALKISQTQPGAALKDGRSASGGISGSLRSMLVIAEFSLTVLLLAGAGLLLRSFSRLQAVDPGFDPTRVLSVQLTPDRNSTPDQWRVFYGQVSERIAALPGVEAIGLTSEIFISGNPSELVTLEGAAPEAAATARIPFRRDVIGESFFQTLRVPLRKGRFFSPQDNQAAEPVTIINETMARQFWPGEEALGKRFRLGRAQSTNPWLTVVGVVGDMRRQSLERQPIAQIFSPHLQSPEQRRLMLLIRTTGEPAQFAAVVRNEIRAIDKTVLVSGGATLESLLARNMGQRRFQTWLLALFSVIALLLAAVGIYGVMSYLVTQHRREIGIRMALGAQARDVLRLVIGQGMSLALCGVGIGLLAAFGLTQVLTGLLFGVTATDPATFIATPMVLLLVALLACYLPARRATKVDPMLALRQD